MEADSEITIGTVSIKSELEDASDEVDNSQQLQRDTLTTVKVEKQHHLCSIEWLPSPGVFTCGSCVAQFDTICYLHDHIQVHGLGGSYHYDNNSKTAFPKYGSVCSDSQTQTPAATESTNLKSRIIHVGHFNPGLSKRNVANNNVRQKDVGICGTSDSVEGNTDLENTSQQLQSYTASANIQQTDISLCLTADSIGSEDDYPTNASKGPAQTPMVITLRSNLSKENTSTEILNLKPRIINVGKLKSELRTRNVMQDNERHKDVVTCVTSDLVEKTDHENANRQLESFTASGNIQQTDISLWLTADSCESEDDYQANASERPEIYSASHSENGISVKGLVMPEHNYCALVEPCHEWPQVGEKQIALGDDSKDTHQQENATSTVRINEGQNSSQKKHGTEGCIKHEDGYLELPNVTGESSLDQPNETVIQYTCFKCKLVFSSEDFLQTHMLKHEGRLICNCCDEIFWSLKELQSHLLDKGRGSQGVKIINCSYCGLMITEFQGLKAHLCLSVMDSALGRQAVRLYTGSVARKQNVLGHLPLTKEYTSDNSESRVQCEVCKLSFENEYFRILHSVKHTHLIKCRTCSFHFLSTGYRKKHVASCLSPGAHVTCSDCGKRFKRQRNLTVHLRLHDMDLTDKRCELCGKTFRNKLCFHSHIRFCSGPKISDDDNKQKGNQGSKIFKCEKCNKVFDKSHFNWHMKFTHSEARPFVCDECGATYKTKSGLRRHKITHQEDRPIYKCSECSATFKEPMSLQRHKKRHLKQFTELCTYCGKMFFERWNLKAHMRQHTGEKPYKCDKCGKGFTHNVSKKAHMSKCCK